MQKTFSWALVSVDEGLEFLLCPVTRIEGSGGEDRLNRGSVEAVLMNGWPSVFAAIYARG